MSELRTVRVIPPIKKQSINPESNSFVKRRVAAYARVSTDSDEQLTSYEAQVDYYTKFIRENSQWEFVDVYTDEGISAVNTKKRDGFNKMVADALSGKIDLIVTKSVSRFARNTVDSLVTVRKLKEKCVEVYFQKENIYTLDSKGELLITIMSSLAQEESRSISENVTWGHRKRFSDGKVSLPYKNFLGYEKGSDGFPKVVPEQAAIVKKIYKLFMDGKTPSHIAKQLTSERVPTPQGKEIWPSTTILSILQNEKYKGSALLQKKFTEDFLTKKMKINEGEVPQYYVEYSHEAIIDPFEFNMVQAEIARRKKYGRAYSSISIFSSKIVCGECGAFYGPKVWHSNSKYKRTIWQCNNKFRGDKKCLTPHLYEEDIMKEFVKQFNNIISNKDEIIDNCKLTIDLVSDCSVIDRQIAENKTRLEILEGLIRKLISQNASTEIAQDEYLIKYQDLNKQYEETKDKLDKLENDKKQRQQKRDQMRTFIYELEKQKEVISEFDEGLFALTVDRIMVDKEKINIFFKSTCI